MICSCGAFCTPRQKTIRSAVCHYEQCPKCGRCEINDQIRRAFAEDNPEEAERIALEAPAGSVVLKNQ